MKKLIATIAVLTIAVQTRGPYRLSDTQAINS